MEFIRIYYIEKGSIQVLDTVHTPTYFFFSKTAHRMFLTLIINLGCLRGKKLAQLDFSGGKCHFDDNSQKDPKNRVFQILQKNLFHSLLHFLGLNHAP